MSKIYDALRKSQAGRESSPREEEPSWAPPPGDEPPPTEPPEPPEAPEARSDGPDPVELPPLVDFPEGFWKAVGRVASDR